MPRLIRMTSDSLTGHFNNNYQAEIVLPPNSQMCLQNLTAKLPAVMTIGALNKEVRFTPTNANVEGGYKLDGQRVVNIPEGVYSENDKGETYMPFGEVVENTLNSGLTSLKSASSAKPPAEISVLDRGGIVDFFPEGRRGSKKDIGGEWKVDLTDKANAKIIYKQQATYITELDAAGGLKYDANNGFTKTGKADTVGVLGIASMPTIGPLYTNIPANALAMYADINITPAPVAGESKSFIYGTKHMAIGGGVFGFRINEAENGTGGSLNGSAPDSGILYGLVEGDPSNAVSADGVFDRTKIKYGVHIRGSANGIAIIRDGVSVAPSITDPAPFNQVEFIWSTAQQQAGAEEDPIDYRNLPYVEIGFDMGRLEARTYQYNSGATPAVERRIINQFYIDNDDTKGRDFSEIMGQTKLYPVVLFSSTHPTTGAYGAHSITELYFTATPHDTSEKTGGGFGATRQIGDPTLTAEAWIRFAPQVANYFGFSDADLPPSAPLLGTSYTNDLTFTGGAISTSTGFPENFVVELLTLPLDSYDGQELLANGGLAGTGQRESILATIPQDRDSNGVLRHETGDPYFIDLDNLEPILLRNLFIRLLDHNLDQVAMNGQGCITLLTREKGRQ